MSFLFNAIGMASAGGWVIQVSHMTPAGGLDRPLARVQEVLDRQVRCSRATGRE